MARKFFTDSSIRIVLEHALIEKFRSDAGLVLTPNADGVGWTARIISSDGDLEFGRAGSVDPVDAVQLACSRAEANFDAAMADDDADAEITDE
jgi:hypothetical protein